MPEFNIILKSLPTQMVASIREQMEGMERLGTLFGEIEKYIKLRSGKINGPGTIVYHEYFDSGIDAEAVWPIVSAIPEEGNIRVYELPGTDAACLVYNGTFEGVGAAHQAIGEWIEEHGYRIAGPNRIVFLDCGDDSNREGKAVIELQYPVEPV